MKRMGELINSGNALGKQEVEETKLPEINRYK